MNPSTRRSNASNWAFVTLMAGVLAGFLHCNALAEQASRHDAAMATANARAWLAETYPGRLARVSQCSGLGRCDVRVAGLAPFVLRCSRRPGNAWCVGWRDSRLSYDGH